MQFYFLALLVLVVLTQVVIAQRFNKPADIKGAPQNPRASNAPGLQDAQRKLQEMASARAARTNTAQPKRAASSAKTAPNAKGSTKQAKKSFNPVRR